MTQPAGPAARHGLCWLGLCSEGGGADRLAATFRRCPIATTLPSLARSASRWFSLPANRYLKRHQRWPLFGLPLPDSWRSLRQASQRPPTPPPGTRPLVALGRLRVSSGRPKRECLLSFSYENGSEVCLFVSTFEIQRRRWAPTAPSILVPWDPSADRSQRSGSSTWRPSSG